MPRRAHFLPFLFLAALSGCGSGTGTVTGKVTLGAKPVTSGQVVFLTAGGVPIGAFIDAAGRYELAKLPAGEMRIRIVNSMVRPGSGPVKDPDEHPKAAPPPLIPKQYDNPDNGLKYTVRTGTQTHDIELRP